MPEILANSHSACTRFFYDLITASAVPQRGTPEGVNFC